MKEREMAMARFLENMRRRRNLERILQRMQSFEHNPPGQRVPFVLAVSGDKGSGKSTICSEFAVRFGYEYRYSGGIMRALAKEAGFDDPHRWYAEELSKNPDLEISVDKKMKDFMGAHPYVVAEGRMTPFFDIAGIRVLKVYISVSESVGAQRLSKRSDYLGLSTEEIIAKVKQTTKNERERYRDLYGIPDHLDKSKFDLVIDTSHLNQEEAFSEFLFRIFEFLKVRASEFLAQKTFPPE